MAHEVYLALGSNIGDREENLRQAITGISSIEKVSVWKCSNIYETDPVGYTHQEKFLNMVVCVETGLSPIALLKKLQEIELKLKRTRVIHWGPRTIDIDILLYDTLYIEEPQLVIPHPRMFERAFVMIPFRDVYPQDEVRGKNIEDIISRCEDKNGVHFYKELTGDNE